MAEPPYQIFTDSDVQELLTAIDAELRSDYCRQVIKEKAKEAGIEIFEDGTGYEAGECPF